MLNQTQRIERIRYLMRLVAKSKKGQSSNGSDYEDLEELNPFQERETTLKEMLKDNPIDKSLYESISIEAQQETEQTIKELYKDAVFGKDQTNALKVDKHLKYVMKSLSDPLSYPYQVLDANHGWLIYWLVNPRKILASDELPQGMKKLVSAKVASCIVDDGRGGIAGGSNQCGHIAPTYSSVLALACLGEFELLDSIRENLYKWMMGLKKPNGSFMMHRNGESDTRSTYCTLVVASLLNLLTEELVEGTAEWISTCQTYEGGFAGQPGDEAHGGYTFCATASYFLLLGKGGKLYESLNSYIDVENLIKWSVDRQLRLEGGFNGRSNKLVDSCYSFWVGATLSMLEVCTGYPELFDRAALANYLLICAQNTKGGFRDKPGKSVDFHHTNYSVCGLSICQHSLISRKPTVFGEDSQKNTDKDSHDSHAYGFEVGSQLYNDIKVDPINPVFSIPLASVTGCKLHFCNFVSPNPSH